MMDRDETRLEVMANAVKSAVLEAGFTDYYFVGMNNFGHRVSCSSVGQDGPQFSWDNCERMDRIVGAMTRQIVSWQASVEIKSSTEDADEDD